MFSVGPVTSEQAEGKEIDARSDIFSLGAVLYEMVTGRRAFQGDSKLSTLSAILKEEPGPVPAEVPRDLEKIIVRCLRKDPSRRFQHAGDLKLALLELKEESDSGKLAAPGAVTAPSHRARVWWLLAGTVLVGAVTLARNLGSATHNDGAVGRSEDSAADQLCGAASNSSTFAGRKTGSLLLGWRK